MRRTVTEKSRSGGNGFPVTADLKRFTDLLPRIRRETKALSDTLRGVPGISGMIGKFRDAAARYGGNGENNVPSFRDTPKGLRKNAVSAFYGLSGQLLPDADSVLNAIRAQLPDTDVSASCIMNQADLRNSAASHVQERAAKAAEESVKILKKIQKNTEYEGCYQ